MKKNKNSVKHNKIKNTGILFELLTRQLTSDIINGVKDSMAQNLIEKFFRKDNELGKEYLLYQALMKYKDHNKDKAKDFLSEVIRIRAGINKSKLNKEKYNLIKEIRDSFDIDDFFKAKIDNYKLLASIYQIFEYDNTKFDSQPEKILDSKYTIVENIVKSDKKKDDVVDENKELIEEFNKQTKDLKLLTYKMMVESFNNKYSGLNEKQKILIKEYINNISSANSLKNYINSEVPQLVEELSSLIKNEKCNKATKIKVTEVCNQLESLTENHNIDENHLFAIMSSYELIKEIKKIIGDK